VVFLLIEIQVIVPIPRYGTGVKESLNKIKIKSQNSNTTLFIGRKLLFYFFKSHYHNDLKLSYCIQTYLWQVCNVPLKPCFYIIPGYLYYDS
jgi:hypothetical protein